jgi:1-aminocyclopropane-1-carboxylate deaminase/D-cysteine desulfhydrase-like pyridoxal-dependent ACC family enzyme
MSTRSSSRGHDGPPSGPLVFHAYPGLRGSIPWTGLGQFPTRVHRLGNLKGRNIWIKRDDESSTEYGGNKVRKLEFTLADAIRRGKKMIITMGGIGTNHGLATAIFAARLGLRCRLLLFEQPVNEYVKRNMLLFQKYGVEFAYYRTILATGIMYNTLEHLIHPGAYFLYAGGSSPLGTMGPVNAMFELKGQIDRGELPLPKYIFCPLGSNGTMAGLSLGALLAGIDTQVIGVRVTVDRVGPLPIATPETARALMASTHRLMKRHSPEVPDIRIPAQRVIDDYVGDGYGCATDGCRRALELLREREGISLDPTYTAKTFAALLDFTDEQAHRTEPILYWHTYNSVDLTAQLAGVDYHDLPASLHRFFAGG